MCRPFHLYPLTLTEDILKRGCPSFEDDPREGQPKTTTETILTVHDTVLDNRQAKGSDRFCAVIFHHECDLGTPLYAKREHQSKQWMEAGVSVPKKAMSIAYAGEVVASMFWEAKDILLPRKRQSNYKRKLLQSS
ncbi:hypothetical protein TNCV_358411 [Trichonephila clavipes]|nr:hypothetical protein TNCV_358411 [Trichonephila clavipes]